MGYISLHGYMRNTPSDRSASQTPLQSRQEYLTKGKEYIEPHIIQQDEGTRGKTKVLVGLDLPSAGWGTEAGVQSPHWGNCLGQRRNILRLRVKQLICGGLNGMRIRQSLQQPYRPWPGQGHWSPGRGSD